jgi:tetratricopeptide (TPR) repeat protein
MRYLSKSIKLLALSLMVALCGNLGIHATGLSPAGAVPSKPRPALDCSKKANKKKAACQAGHRGMTDDELYNAAYWLARQGSYSDALSLLQDVKVQNDPRVLNAMGYATRKLGNIDAAFPFYQKALAIDANYTKAREYLGEAHLSKGELTEAQVQLREIESRCGKTCSGYAELASEIEAFVKKQNS